MGSHEGSKLAEETWLRTLVFSYARPRQAHTPAPPKVHVVLNWYEEFRDREQ
jgi:hypothetical protein